MIIRRDIKKYLINIFYYQFINVLSLDNRDIVTMYKLLIINIA
jgi:hypothetical protein